MASRLTFPTTFAEAEEILAGGRNKDSRTIANNTRLLRYGVHRIALRLHQTDVVIFHSNGDKVLDSGGWLTVTTKDRINGALAWPQMIVTRKGRWFYKPTEDWDQSTWLPYEDGMIVHADGTASLTHEPEAVAVEDAHNKQMRKDVQKFLDGITPEQIVEAMLNPAAPTRDLYEHVRQNVLTDKMIRDALTSRHFGNPDFVRELIFGSAQNGKIDRAFFRAPMRKYLVRQLTVGAVATA